MTDHHAHDAESVGFGVLTISSSRTPETDESGDALVEAIEDDGQAVVVRDLATDDEQAIAHRVEELVSHEGIDAVVTTGGTGLSPDDVTVEALSPLFDRKIPGFGEQFRAQSVDEVGPHGMLTRATAGIVDGVPVFCLPGSEQAASFGATKLVLPVVSHVVGLATGGGHETDSDGHDHHNHDHGTHE